LTGSPGWRTRSPRARPGPRRARGGTKRRRGAHNRPALVWGDDEPGAQVRSVRSGVAGLPQLLPTVRQQFLDPPRQMRADPVEHVAEVCPGLHAQPLARLHVLRIRPANPLRDAGDRRTATRDLPANVRTSATCRPTRLCSGWHLARRSRPSTYAKLPRSRDDPSHAVSLRTDISSEMVTVAGLLSRGWLSGRGRRQPRPGPAAPRSTGRPPAG
jgi:hypothetical protein